MTVSTAKLMGAGGSKAAEDGGALVSGMSVWLRLCRSMHRVISGVRRSRGRLNDRTKPSLRNKARLRPIFSI